MPWLCFHLHNEEPIETMKWSNIWHSVPILPGATNQCCGCPTWSSAGSCKAHNVKWESPALPETFAKPFKTACPTAYSFPYDDPTSTYTCQAATAQGVGYQITFCP